MNDEKETYYMNDIADCLFNNSQVCGGCYERRYLDITVNALKEAEGLEI